MTTLNNQSLIIKSDLAGVDWQELADVYRLAPLGERNPQQLMGAFKKSYLTAIAKMDGKIVAAGRVISDGEYYANIYDIVVLPELQGKGIGRSIMCDLQNRIGNLFILLTTTIGKEPFYQKLGFRKHKTAMAIYPPDKQKNAEMYLEEC